MKLSQGTGRKRSAALLAVAVIIVFGGSKLGSIRVAYATAAPIEFVAARWTKGTAQPGDSGAELNITLADRSVTEMIGTTEVMKLGPVYQYLRSSTGGNLATAYVSAPVDMGEEANATFELDVKPVSPFPPVLYVNISVSYFPLGGSTSLNQTFKDVPIIVTTPSPIALVQTTWNPSGGVQGDQGDTLTLLMENPNPFPITQLTGSIPGPDTELSSPTGSQSISATPAPREVLPPNGEGTLNYTVDIASKAKIGADKLKFIANYTDQWGGPLSTEGTAIVNVLGNGSPTLTVLDNTVIVGGTNQVSFELTNVGSAPLYNPSFVLQAGLPLVISSNSTFSTTTPIMPKGKPGSTMRFTAQVTTGPNALPESYPGTLSFAYTDSLGTQFNQTYSVGFDVSGSAQASVSLATVSNTVEVGNGSLVNFEISDSGSGSMYYPTATLQVSAPLVIVSGSVYASDTPVAPGDSIDFNASLTAESNALGGNYPGTLTVTYEDQFNVLHTLTFSVGFLVQGTTLTTVSVTALADAVNVGNQSQVVFQIENVGNETMFSPSFSLTVTPPLVITSNSTASSSSEIAPFNGTIYEAEITVGPSVPVGAYPGTLTIEYLDQFGVSHTITVAVGFTVSGSVTTAVQVTGVKDSVAVGGEAKTEFSIQDVGNEPMFDPSVTLEVSTPLVIVSNSTFSSSATILPQASLLFESELASGPNTPGGAYPGVIVVTYTDQFGLVHTQNFAVGFTVSGTTETTVTVTPVKDNVTIGSPTPVSFLVTNVGASAMYDPSFTLEVNSPLVLVSNSTFSWDGTLQPGASVDYMAQATTGPSALGGAYAATLLVTYDDNFGVEHTQSLAVGLIVSGSTGTAISVATEQNTLVVGSTSTLLFRITNLGGQSMYTPQFTLQVASPLVVTSNSTYSYGGILTPGKSASLEVAITNGPKTPIQAYTGDLDVTYTDKFGVSHSQNFTVGFVVIGTVHLVVLNEQATQNLDNLTISGTLLNDGTASAFYSNITASLTDAPGVSLGNATEYIGEVNPTSPVPFTLVIPFSSGDKGFNGSLGLTTYYEDNYRTSGNLSSAYPVQIQPASLLPEVLAAKAKAQTRSTEEKLAAAGVIVGVAALVSIFVLRRRSANKNVKGPWGVPSPWASK